MEVNMWLTCAGTYKEVQLKAMEEYFQKNGIAYAELLYELDDYSDIVAVSPEFDKAKLEETGYESGGALKPEETNLAFKLYDTQNPDVVDTIPVFCEEFEEDDNFGNFTVEVYKEVKVLKGVTYNIYHCEDINA